MHIHVYLHLQVLGSKTGHQGLQGIGWSALGIGPLVPRMFVCTASSCLAILRIEGCPNSTL